MKLLHASTVILLANIAAPALAQEGPLPVSDELKVPDKRLREYWSKSVCYERGDKSEPNVREQCKEVCFPNPDPKKLSASTCWLSGSKWLDGSSGKELENQKTNIPKTAIRGGYCGCDDPIILFAGDFFIKAVTEAGKIIEKVVCPALQALDVIIEFGSLAIPPPGKAIQGGMIAAVKTAKAYKYAYEAQDAAQEWANMIFGGLSTSEAAGCGKPPFSLAKLAAKFFEIADVPDATLPGGIDYGALPCPKGGCRGTRQGEKPQDKPQDKPEDKPKPSEPPKTNTPPTKSTAAETTYTPKATQTADCKAIAEKLESERPAERRDIARTIHERRVLQKRGTKSGKACQLKKSDKNSGWVISSFNYPSNPVDEAKEDSPDLGFDSEAYGWTQSRSCDDYSWGLAHLTKDTKDRYETEHILEWSVITNFFTDLNGKFKPDEFEHPEPAMKGKKVNFCEYWEESWKFDDKQVMPNPAPQSGAKPQAKDHNPIGWIAANYPYTDRNGGDFTGEFKLLQKLINNPAKNNMFDPEKVIYNDKDMEDLIKWSDKKNKVEETRKAIHRIRSVIGVFLYMKDKEIAKIFKDEKQRIGKVLEGIDQNLPKTPRINGKVTYAPWKPLDLGAKWDKYMDQVFETAKDKGTKFVEKNIQRLKDEYTSPAAKARAKDNSSESKKERDNKEEWRKAGEDIEKIVESMEKVWNNSGGPNLPGAEVNAKNWVKPW